MIVAYGTAHGNRRFGGYNLAPRSQRDTKIGGNGALRTPGGPQKGLIGNSRFNRKTKEKQRKTKKTNKTQGKTKKICDLKLTG